MNLNNLTIDELYLVKDQINQVILNKLNETDNTYGVSNNDNCNIIDNDCNETITLTSEYLNDI